MSVLGLGLSVTGVVISYKLTGNYKPVLIYEVS